MTYRTSISRQHSLTTSTVHNQGPLRSYQPSLNYLSHPLDYPLPMSAAFLLRARYPFRAPSTAVDHLVVGGGVVGLAVAAGLVNTAGADRTTFVVERRGMVRSFAWWVAAQAHRQCSSGRRTRMYKVHLIDASRWRGAGLMLVRVTRR